MPVVGHDQCEVAHRKTRLLAKDSSLTTLHRRWWRRVAEKDTCKGDGGSPLCAQQVRPNSSRPGWNWLPGNWLAERTTPPASMLSGQGVYGLTTPWAVAGQRSGTTPATGATLSSKCQTWMDAELSRLNTRRSAAMQKPAPTEEEGRCWHYGVKARTPRTKYTICGVFGPNWTCPALTC